MSGQGSLADGVASVRWALPGGLDATLELEAGEGSLAVWIALNLDPSGLGAGCLSVLEDVLVADPPPSWREDLLLAAREWATQAQRLVGSTSVVWTSRCGIEVVDETQTRGYVEWTMQLLRFAEIVFANGLDVELWVDRRAP